MGPCGYGIRLVLSSPRMSVVGVVVVFRSQPRGLVQKIRYVLIRDININSSFVIMF
jgi:hypothetical protein